MRTESVSLGPGVNGKTAGFKNAHGAIIAKQAGAHATANIKASKRVIRDYLHRDNSDDGGKPHHHSTLPINIYGERLTPTCLKERLRATASDWRLKHWRL